MEILYLCCSSPPLSSQFRQCPFQRLPLSPVRYSRSNVESNTKHIPRNNFQLLLHLLGESNGHYGSFPAGLRHMKALIGSILCLQREAKDHSPRLIKQGACEALKQAQKTNRKSKTCFAKQNIAILAKCLSPEIVVEDTFHVSFCSDEY